MRPGGHRRSPAGPGGLHRGRHLPDAHGHRLHGAGTHAVGRAEQRRGPLPRGRTHHRTRPDDGPRAGPPARTTSRPAAAPTAAAGRCAHHTTGACGWDAGLRPVSSSQMAECKDGTPSYSANFSGTCSGHGGVRYWFK
ncbi:DUF3761 domain-containing protein [Kitasatospora sp. KL5]|uniref:DUF3761 domain-containing protein n=1 Tax=Kitasatospora sp. KL5 TaxID=3425125 RepID=UPI003D6F4DED